MLKSRPGGELTQRNYSNSDRGSAPSEMSLLKHTLQKVNWRQNKKLRFLKDRKAQIEMLGLVIIVLLISIGILIAIMIFSKPIGKEIKYEQESLLAAHFLNTLAKSDAFCKGRTIGELLQSCAKLDVGFDGAILCENYENGCYQAQSLIRDYLDKVFTQRNLDFFFTIISDNPALDFFTVSQSCRGEYESKTRPLIVIGGQEVNLKLDICG